MPSVSLWAFLAENYFLLQISQPCGAGLFAFSQKKLLLVQRAVAWDRLHSFYKNHRRRGRSAGPEAGRGVSSPPSLPLDSTHPATRKGLLAPFRPRRGSRSGKMLAASLNAFFHFSDLLLRSWCYLSADGKVLLKLEIFGEAVKRRRLKMRLRDLHSEWRESPAF